MELVTRNYWWPRVIKKVKRYDICQWYKNRSKVLAGKLMPNTISEKPWSYIPADLITKLYCSMKSNQTRTRTQTLLELYQMLYHWAIRSFRVLQCDQIPYSVKLLLIQEYNAILVVCNQFSKMVHFIATMKKMSVEGLTKLFRDHIWKLHKLPESIISDKGIQFTTRLIKKLNSLLGIQTKLSIVYHSQTDKQMERANQELEQYLRVFINHRQEQWSKN